MGNSTQRLPLSSDYYCSSDGWSGDPTRLQADRLCPHSRMKGTDRAINLQRRLQDSRRAELRSACKEVWGIFLQQFLPDCMALTPPNSPPLWARVSGGYLIILLCTTYLRTSPTLLSISKCTADAIDVRGLLYCMFALCKVHHASEVHVLL